MNKILARPFAYLSAFLACSILALNTGCVSGGFKLTRTYARWLNSQNLVIRIILYILLGIVFAVTLLVDVVIFNTVDFWEGKVSAGTYEFRQGDKIYVAKHEFLPESHLRRSTLRISDKDHGILQEIVLTETTLGEIEMYVDGHLKTRVQNIDQVPVASHFDAAGRLTVQKLLVLSGDSLVEAPMPVLATTK